MWSQEGVAWEERKRLSQELGAGVEQAFVCSGCGRVEVGRTPRLGLGSPKAAWSGNPSLETMWAWPHVGLVWEQCVSARIGCKGRVGEALEPPRGGAGPEPRLGYRVTQSRVCRGNSLSPIFRGLRTRTEAMGTAKGVGAEWEGTGPPGKARGLREGVLR